MPADERRSLDIGVSLPVTVLWLLFWWPQLVGARLLFMRDLSLFAAPSKQYWLERLGAGELPAWSAQISGGLPFLADPANQSFYPLNLLMLSSADLMTALTRFVLVHLLIGMLGTAGMVRKLGGSRLAAVFAAGLYGLCGYAVSITDNITYIGGLAWVPVALAGWLHARRGGGSGGLVVAALAVAGAVLAGDVLAAAVACGAMLLLTIDDGAGKRDGWSRVFGGLGALLLVLSLSLLLSAMQVLPTLSMFADSGRAAGLHFARQTAWSFPLARTLEMVQPFFFGSSYPMLEFLAPDLYPSMRSPWVHSVYVGLLPVVLAVAGLATATRRSLPWLLLGLFCLLLAFGSNSPWHAWFAEVLPLLATQRYPEKLVIWVTLVVVLLAARGLDALRRGEGPFGWLATSSGFARISLTLALFATQFFLLLDWPARLLVWSHAQSVSGFWSLLFGGQTTHLQGLLLHSVPVALALASLLWVPARAYPVLAAVLVPFALLDLALVHRPTIPVVAPELAMTRSPIALELLRKHGGEGARIYFDDEVPGKDVRYRNGRIAARVLDSLGRHGDARPRGYLLVYALVFQQERLSLRFGTRLGVSYLNGRLSPLQPASHVGLEQALHGSGADRLLAAAGTHFVITAIEPTNLAFEIDGLVEVARDDELNLRLLAVREPQPFARVASVVREVVSGDSYDTLVALHISDAQAVLVESGAAMPVEFPGPATGRVRGWRRPTPERIEIELADVSETSLVVVNESWAPGWRAIADGVPTTLRRADLRLQGVTAPAGTRNVVLQYRTPGLLAGLGLSASGLLLCVLLVLRDRRR